MNDFKKKLYDKIQIYSNKEYLDNYIKNEFMTDEGNANIFLSVQNKDDIFDVWTVGNQVDLERDVYDYIEEKTEMLGNDVPIKLTFVGCSF